MAHVITVLPSPAMPAPATSRPALRPCIVVMGVTGCGKSTVGRQLSKALGLPFVEGDDFHPDTNLAKMASGQPLDDADRAGWLKALASRLRSAARRNEGAVLSCSALKRRYRDVLRNGSPSVRFVFLDGHRALIAARLANRTGHFMPASLLESQFGDLETPGTDETSLSCDAALPPEEIVRLISAWLAEFPAS